MSLFPTLEKEYLQSWGSEDPHRVLLGFISYSFTKISIRILTYMLNHLLISSLIYSILLIAGASGLQRWIIKVSWLWDTRYLLCKSRNQQWQDNLLCELTVLPNSDLAARCSKTNNWEENISRKERWRKDALIRKVSNLGRSGTSVPRPALKILFSHESF